MSAITARDDTSMEKKERKRQFGVSYSHCPGISLEAGCCLLLLTKDDSRSLARSVIIRARGALIVVKMQSADKRSRFLFVCGQNGAYTGNVQKRRNVEEKLKNFEKKRRGRIEKYSRCFYHKFFILFYYFIISYYFFIN